MPHLLIDQMNLLCSENFCPCTRAFILFLTYLLDRSMHEVQKKQITTNKFDKYAYLSNTQEIELFLNLTGIENGIENERFLLM